MEILTSVRRRYISFKSLVNDFVYSFGRAALLLLVEVQNHTVPVRERHRIRVNSRNDGRGETCRSSNNYDCSSLHNLLFTSRLLLDVSFITSIKSNLCAALITQNSTEHHSVISLSLSLSHTHTHTHFLLQFNVFVTGIKQLPFTCKEHSAFPRGEKLSRSNLTSSFSIIKFIKRLLFCYEMQAGMWVLH